MKTKDVIEHFKSREALAAAIGVDRSALAHWGDEVPFLRQYQIEVLTAGRFMATREKRTRKAA